jgi:hypothetical protein
VLREACKLGCEGILSKRLGSMYRRGRSPHWVKVKNPNAPAVKREAEEDWSRLGPAAANRVQALASRLDIPKCSAPQLKLRVRRGAFPPRWAIEEQSACFIVRDHSEQALAYVYFEDEPGRRSAAKLMTRDEARRIAANIAKLPDLLGGKSQP